MARLLHEDLGVIQWLEEAWGTRERNGRDGYFRFVGARVVPRAEGRRWPGVSPATYDWWRC